MNFVLNNKEVSFIKFCDYVELTNNNDDVYSFNIVWIKSNKFYLQGEDERLIKELQIINSRLLIYYLNGEVDEIENIKEINVFDYRFRRKYFFGIEGTFLSYTEDMAIKYNLDKNLSSATLGSTMIKRRVLEKEDF
ncbi:MAG: hypothetical protein IJZ46_02865 [Bacilli bacterium]|nr:hypothetical protein [Bacilli bacterium]